MATDEPSTDACRKCGCTTLITQLRHVHLDVGWTSTQLDAIAPCKMCSKCGNLTVVINAVVGDLAALVPDPAVKPPQAKKAPSKTKAAKKKRTQKQREADARKRGKKKATKKKR